jgi:hypothetical protein
MRPLAGSQLPIRQRGVVVLVFFLILFVTITTVYLTAANNRTQGADPARSAQMQQAKQALLGFSLSAPENFTGRGPGLLPCPDTNNNGLPNTPCNTNTPGRLPHKIVIPGGDYLFSTLQSPNDNQYWYAVSSNFRFLPDAALNSGSATALSLNGASDFVAVIIDAGPALTGQTRPNNTVGNYLEGTHIDGLIFNSAPPSATQNDRIIGITRAELMSVVVPKVAVSIARLINTNPYPLDHSALTDLLAAAAAPDNWLNNDQWAAVITYAFTPGPPDSATLSFSNCSIQFTLSGSPPAVTRTGTRC